MSDRLTEQTDKEIVVSEETFSEKSSECSENPENHENVSSEGIENAIEELKSFDTETTLTMEKGKSGFRFANQKVLLTYKFHLVKDVVREYFQRNWGFKKFYIAHENGDKLNPYPHTHIVVDFGKAVQSRNPRFLDLPHVENTMAYVSHPNIRYIPNIVAWKKACLYICKEDKTVELEDEDCFKKKEKKGFGGQSQEDDDSELIHKIWAAKSVRDALLLAPVKYATQVIAIYNNRPKEPIVPKITEEQLFPWQAELKNHLLRPADDRTIIWLYDSVGLNGKSSFADYMELTYPEKVIYLNAVGNAGAFEQNMKNKRDEGWEGSVVFVNLTRSTEDTVGIYRACETLKDKRLTFTKYTGGTWRLRHDIHVVVMANFLPNVRSVSLDRWRIYDIANWNFSKPMNVHEAERRAIKEKIDKANAQTYSINTGSGGILDWVVPIPDRKE